MPYNQEQWNIDRRDEVERSGERTRGWLTCAHCRARLKRDKCSKLLQRLVALPSLLLTARFNAKYENEIRRDRRRLTHSLQLILRCISNVPYRILNLALHRFNLSRCAFGQGALFAKLVDVFVRLGYAL